MPWPWSGQHNGDDNGTGTAGYIDVANRTTDVHFDQTTLPDFGLFYRHSLTLTAVYCVAYAFVFVVGLVGNSFVIAVVMRSPRMRTVTNFFIVNLAVADILVIVFCLPATLMGNIFVRKYYMLSWRRQSPRSLYDLSVCDGRRRERTV